MNLSPNWLREFVDLQVNDERLAQDLTHAGIAVEGVSRVGDETVFAMEITTNRVDAMNHYGVARECSAIYDLDLKPISPKLPAGEAAGSFPIEIEAPELCARYTAREIRGVKIEKSPRYISERLMIEDHHGINNVADATNYALMEMGHPTHAFDLDELEGGKIIVRLARAGERIKTLDGVDRELHPDDLVIADAVKPVALAGVMGGFDSMITANTRNILIESAWFDPATVRQTARRHGMHTDASHRFERGADWGATPVACDRVTELVLQTAGGKLGRYNDAVARDLRRAPVELDRTEIRRILGQEIPEAVTTRILRRLGFTLTPERLAVAAGLPSGVAVVESPEAYSVAIPTWRMDVEREIDIIEEVARVFGYNNFANTLPEFSGSVVEQPHARALSKVRAHVLALGYDEAVSSTFISSEDAKTFSATAPVALENPLSEETPLLRNGLVPGMLGMLAWNFNRGADDIRLFEIGNVFEMRRSAVQEARHLCFAASGAATPASIEHPARLLDFYDLKGDVEDLLGLFSVAEVRFDAPGPAYLHPGRSATISLNGHRAGELGQLHPDVASAKKIKQVVWIANLDLDQLLQIPLREPRFERLSRYPAVERDFSLVLDEGTNYDRLRRTVEALKIPELISVEPTEIFRGGNLPAGKYAMLLRVVFQAADRTLRDDEINLWSKQVVAAVESIGGSLRS